MRKILLLLTLSTVLFSCKNFEDKYVLNGFVKGIPNGKNIILEKQNESMGINMPVDTAKIENGKFKFEGKITEPSLYMISIEGIRGKSFVILENGEINIDINKDSIFLNKISGTYNNDQLTEYNASGIKFQKKVKAFKDANGPKMKEAMATKDTATINQLRAQYKLLMDEMMGNSEKYVETHPKSFLSLLLIESFFSTPSPDIKKIEGFYSNLDAELKNTKAGKKIEKTIADTKTVSIGRKAPEFAAPDVNGKKTALNESLGRITIIDFWASWCKPCRAENPNMVALYNEFHAKGLNIIGVSLDKTANEWKTAIAEDKLAWTQVSNLKFWDEPIATTYGVKSIPATFVLNQYGVVVAKDLKGPELRAKITEMLKVK